MCASRRSAPQEPDTYSDRGEHAAPERSAENALSEEWVVPALEELLAMYPKRAFIVNASSELVMASASGRVALADDREATLREIESSVRGAGPLRRTEIRGGMAVLVDERTEDAAYAQERRVRRALGIGPREAEVLRLVSKGLGNADIADALGVTLRMIEGHVARLLDRFGVDSRAGLIARFWSLSEDASAGADPQKGRSDGKDEG
jgi:DNA-binding CsgD family transcriptional regulator